MSFPGVTAAQLGAPTSCLLCIQASRGTFAFFGLDRVQCAHLTNSDLPKVTPVGS